MSNKNIFIENEVKIVKNLPVNVIAVDGKEYPRNKCRRINGVWYLIGDINVKDSGHGILMGETFYRISPFGPNAKVAWDEYNKRYDVISNMKMCLVDEKGTMGYSSSVTSEFAKIGGNFVNVASEKLLENLEYYVDNVGGNHYWVLPQSISMKDQINELIKYAGRVKKLHYRKYPMDIYNMADYPKEFLRSPKKGESSPFDRFLEPFSFGTEIETAAGMLSEYHMEKYGVVPLKDGSITGHEYTTVPYMGEGSFDNLGKLFEQLSKTTVSNIQCSLHYHIGNIPVSKEFVVSMYLLYYRIQDELDYIMPPYKRNIHFLATKPGGPKDHCARIEPIMRGTIDEMYNQILNFLCDGRAIKESKDLLYDHPNAGRPKWDWHSRYVSLNFLPFLFDRKRTVEFRLHSGTVNKHKALSWLFICVALVKYAMKNSAKILQFKDKIFLEDIVNDIYNDDTKEGIFLSNYLQHYMLDRKQNHKAIYFADPQRGEGNEFKNDNVYMFNLGGKNLFNYK